MHTATPDALLAQLHWRYATKKFDSSKKIPAATWQAIEESIALAPSSYGLQPWKFVTVADPELRTKLQAMSFKQPQIVDASHMVVFARKAEVTVADVDVFVARIVAVRGGTAEALKGYRDMMASAVSNPDTLPGESMDTYTRAQTYIALGFALYTAAQFGIDACPMEGIEAPKYDEALGLTALGYKASCVATFGYRSSEDATGKLAKVRFAHESLFIRK